MIPEELKTAVQSQFRVDAEVGRGGMATVYRAWDLRHDRPVAIKVLHPELANAIGIDRFLREIRTSARLQHPHLIPVLDSGRTTSSAFYVMPLIEGQNLRERLRANGRIDEATVRRIAFEIADALAYAHHHGEIHRDVKPENILLAEGHAYLADFGISRAIRGAENAALTTTGAVIGTPRYMSPEQAVGDLRLDGRSDVYSLGCVLFEAVTGRAAQGTARIRDENPEISREFARILERSLAPAPDDRFPSAAAMRDALTGTAPTIPRVRRAGLVLAGLGLVVAAAWLAVRFIPGGSHEASPRPSEPVAAVLPFQVHGGGEAQYLATGLASLLADELNGSAARRCVDPRTLLQAIEGSPGVLDDPAARNRLLTRLGADRRLSGEAMIVGDHLRVSARFFGGAAMDSVEFSASSEGDIDSMSVLVARVAAGLLAAWPGATSEYAAVASRAPRPLAAIRAYLDGEAASRAGGSGAAVAYYAAAVAADTTYALAWNRLVESYAAIGEFDQARETIGHARRAAPNWSSREQLYFDAVSGYVTGDVDRSIKAYRQLTDSDPYDVEAWRGLGRTLAVYQTVAGIRVEDTKDVNSRLLQLAPDDFEALNHAYTFALGDKNKARADSIAKRLLATFEDPRDGDFLRYQQMVFAGQREEALEFLAGREPADPDLLIMATDPFLREEDIDGALRALALADRPGQPLVHRLYARIRSSWMEQGRGNEAAARSWLRKAREFNPSIATIYGALTACDLAVPQEPSIRDSLYGALAGLPESDESFAGSIAGTNYLKFEGSWTTTRLYVLGLLDAAAGRAERAEHFAGRLEQFRDSEVERAWSQVYAMSIRARLAYVQGRHRESLALLEGQKIWSQPGARMGFRTLTHERYLRSRLLTEFGRPEEALLGLRGSFWYDMIHQGPASLERGRLLEQLGRTEEAATQYRRVVRLLEHADAKFLPVATAARKGLERVAAGDDS